MVQVPCNYPFKLSETRPVRLMSLQYLGAWLGLLQPERVRMEIFFRASELLEDKSLSLQYSENPKLESFRVEHHAMAL